MPGAVPADTVIMFAIGGYAYSIKPNPWSWLTSKEAAEKMAEKVGTKFFKIKSTQDFFAKIRRINSLKSARI